MRKKVVGKVIKSLVACAMIVTILVCSYLGRAKADTVSDIQSSIQEKQAGHFCLIDNYLCPYYT